MGKLTKKEKKLTLRHYWEMRKFAKSRPKEEEVNVILMRKNIGQDWYNISCVLCKKYLTGDVGSGCHKCPLYQNNMACYNVPSLWQEMSCSSTWAKFIINLNKFVEAFLEIPVEGETQ